MELINKELCKILVSSVLDQNGKEYGKQFLNDGNEDTCWYSDQGNPQYIKLRFFEKQSFSKLKLQVQFQGGFAGEKCALNSSSFSMPFHPKDSNNIQEFEFEELEDFEELQLVFNSSSDFYGRVIIYQLSLIGS
ncbi:unnamed protein product [Oikopleura dioica]|uniref:Nuclear receptor 2C2-associated protein n=1 Tax=Oikopleura dioica TaxID=34765 RepID=E4X6S9_OIKDI|nr:unnamed protein product [Oikopleura dioica]